MRLFAALAVLLVATAALADNDDTCDIGHAPAATLLLPYFEVDFLSPQQYARTTLFTIQNTSAMPQIARVTLWTDWGYPMLTFNVFLTGFGVQGINLYDIFARGAVAGGSNQTTPGPRSLRNDQNPGFLPDAASTCSSDPGPLSAALVAELRDAFATGKISTPGCTNVNRVGGRHTNTNAVGYATIDVVANCNATSPLAPGYFTREILFDNVLTGDYQHVDLNPITGNYAGGSPLVHIRTVPEGGPAGVYVATNLPYTFYDLHTAEAPSRTQDRRQPLPSAFLPRVIQGGTGAFNTNLLIWREAFAAPALCPVSYASNGNLPFAEIIRFDEHENATTDFSPGCGGCAPGKLGLPLTSSLSSFNTTTLPSFSYSGDVGGWLYLNLNNGGSRAYSAARSYFGGTTTVGARQSQAWVVRSMFAEGRYAVEMDAAAVGNGCSPAPDLTTRAHIGPAPNANP